MIQVMGKEGRREGGVKGLEGRKEVERLLKRAAVW